MAKTKTPFLSLGAHGSVGGSLTAQKRGKLTLMREQPFPTDPQSSTQLAQRARYLAVIQFWNGLSAAQKQAWLTAARPYRMPGMSLFIRRYMSLTLGLVLYYSFNDRPTVIVQDRSGQGNHGTIFGASPIDGYFGYALVFDGLNDYINSGTGLTAILNASFSLAAWTKRRVLDTHDTVFNHGIGLMPFYTQLLFRYNSNNAFKFSFKGDDLDTAIAYGDEDTWVRWLGTYDHTINDRRLYRDGTLVANDSPAEDYQGSPSDFVVGFKSDPAGDYFGGIIDEAMVWDRVLSPFEILLDYERGSP